jgi:type III protein arginine methyltransferase
MNTDPLDQAFEFYGAGRLDAAAQVCRSVLAGSPDNSDANHLLGVIYFRHGDNVTARSFMAKAAESPKATPEMHNNLGSALMALGDPNAATVAFNRALELKPDYADALNNLGVVHRNEKRIEAAIDAFRRAIALAPNFTQARNNLRAAYRDVVPGWHFAMMDDKDRNDAYEAAIRRAVPGRHVLDIGCGAGLLSMMSARAGAAHVTACEAVAVIADRARDIVAKNGLASRITVIGKPSHQLEIGKDLPQRAEVLVTETFSSGLINESVLPTIEHAHANLLLPAATVIPAAASAMGYLAGGQMLRGLIYAEKINGFDMSPFNDFAPANFGMLLDRFPHEVMSDDVELMRFDLREASFPMANRRVNIEVKRAGVCLGVVQWIKLELDAQTQYENRPSSNAPFNGHWTQVVYRFPKPINVVAGDLVPVNVRHYRTQISVDLIEEEWRPRA